MDGRDLLQLLFPCLDAAHRAEVRVLSDGRCVRRSFCTDIGEALQIAAADAGAADVLFGVAARGGGAGGGRDNLAYAAALWADVDAKCYRDKATALDAIRRTPPLASAVVDSGSGYHAYWALDAPCSLADPAGVDAVEGIMRGLQQALRQPGGRALDACHDAAHLLRVPGTLNHKAPPPLPVAVVELHGDRRYRLDDLACLYVPAAAATCAIGFDGEERDADDVLARAVASGLSARMRDLIVDGGIDPYPSRSERDQAVVVALLGCGTEPDDVRAIFAELPVGERYREPGSGDRYLAGCIGKARAYLAARPTGRTYGALAPDVTERVAVERACRELARISRALPATRAELGRRLRRSRATVEKYLGWGIRLGWYRRAAPADGGPGRPAARYELVDGVRPRVQSGAAYARDAAAVARLRQGALKAQVSGAGDADP